MRVVLVGRPGERERLRRALADLPIDIVGEATALAEARASASEADAFLLPAAVRNAGAQAGEQIESLTPRELEVLELVAEGLPNKAIARKLGISDQTAKFHVASVAAKLGASNRTDSVRRALQRGLIKL